MYHRLTKREKIMLGTAVGAVVFICFYVLVYMPKNKESLRLQNEIRIASLEIERIARAIPELKKIEEEVGRELNKVSLDKKSPSCKQQMQQLLRQLARDAHQLDMDVISLKLKEESGAPQEKLPYGRLTMVMNIQCLYRHLGLYLGGLRDLPGLVSVDGFQAVRNNSSFPKLQVQLMLTAFYSKV